MRTLKILLLAAPLISSGICAELNNEKVCYKLTGSKNDIERLIKADLLTKYTLFESVGGAEQLTLSSNCSHITKTELAIVEKPVTFVFSFNEEKNTLCGWLP